MENVQRYIMKEDQVKKLIRSLNDGKLAEQVYLDDSRIFLGKDQKYNWDLEGKFPLSRFVPTNNCGNFFVSLNSPRSKFEKMGGDLYDK